MKILKYLLINLVILIVLLISFEFILAKDYLSKNPTEKYHIGKIPYSYLFAQKVFREPSGVNFTKRPVIILGCSFAYGESLKEDETFNAKLSEFSSRPVYNYAVKGKALQNALYILKNKLYDKNIKAPEYIVYVMMNDHIRRIYSNVCMGDYVGQPIYKLNLNGDIKLYRENNPVYRQFYTFYYINNLIYDNYLKNDYTRHNAYINAYFKEMKKEIKKQYPDIKFIILLYGDNSNFGLDFSQLQKDGFIVINTQDLTGENLLQRKYNLSDTDSHPTAEVWDIVSKAFVKEFNL